MRTNFFVSALITGSMLAAAPSIASGQTTAPAARLSIAHARTGAASDGSRLDGGSGGIIALALLAGIVAIGVLAAVNNDNAPTSP